jgi:xanthine dehydrogenase YagS FAD-binding subunit
MRPFIYERVNTVTDALHAGALRESPPGSAAEATPEFLAGGTTLIDLMKLDVMRPARVVDINALGRTSVGHITESPNGLRLGALARMSDAASHPVVRRNYPMVAQSLELAASAQLRNMATLAGNVLQRTRCSYFRDVSYSNCNKRIPGSGCAALEGVNRQHAVLGTSGNCIATYPGDFAQALIALDAQVELSSPKGAHLIPFASLHRAPGDTPHIETILSPGELITAFELPGGAWMRRSVYLKIRDRESYEFALASAAVALDLERGAVRAARIALGGVATVPWRAREAEAALVGQPFDQAAAEAAADVAFGAAKVREHNAFKVALGKRTLVRALQQAAAMEV